MTLNTQVWLKGPIDSEEAFTLALDAICQAAERPQDAKSAKVFREPNQISTRAGQGLPAWLWLDRDPNGGALYTDDQYDTNDVGSPDRPYLTNFACAVSFSWDTAYSSREGANGDVDCDLLHARALVYVHGHLPPGVTLKWRNEYTGDVFDGVDGLESLIESGADAQNWFWTVAAPVIAAHLGRDAPEGVRP